MLWIKLAWRNIWRNSRRTILTMLAVLFAVALSVAMRGIQLGTYELNIRNAVRMSSGYLQIQKKGYQTNPSLRKSFPYTRKIQQILDSEEKINGYTPRIYGDALISYRDQSFGAFLVGIDLQTEPLVSDYLNKLGEGQFFQPGDSLGIVVGYKLLQNLKAAIGDTIVLLTQGYDGFLNSMFGVIRGTIKTGNGAYDRMAIFMDLKIAQYFLGMDNRVSVVAISLQRLKDMSTVQRSLLKKLEGTDLTCLTWEEILPELKQGIELDNISGILFLAILVIVVAFGILNTVLMSVTERTREFGILLSVGMPNHRLAIIVLIETFFIVTMGILLGNLLGAGVNYYIVKHPIVFSGGFEALYEEFGWLPRIESTLDWKIFFNMTLSTLIVSFISVLYPLWHVLRLEPLKGIRYT